MSTFILGTESHQNFSWNEPSASLCFFQDYKSVDDYHLLQEQSYSPRRADLFSMAVLQLSRAPSVWITWSEIVSNQHTKDRWIKDCSDFLQFFFFLRRLVPRNGNQSLPYAFSAMLQEELVPLRRQSHSLGHCWYLSSFQWKTWSVGGVHFLCPFCNLGTIQSSVKDILDNLLRVQSQNQLWGMMSDLKNGKKCC